VSLTIIVADIDIVAGIDIFSDNGICLRGSKPSTHSQWSKSLVYKFRATSWHCASLSSRHQSPRE